MGKACFILIGASSHYANKNTYNFSPSKVSYLGNKMLYLKFLRIWIEFSWNLVKCNVVKWVWTPTLSCNELFSLSKHKKRELRAH